MLIVTNTLPLRQAAVDRIVTDCLRGMRQPHRRSGLATLPSVGAVP